MLVDQPTDPSIKDAAITALNKDKNPKLIVTIDATHSGVITNKRVYPAKYVSIGYKSFCSKESGGSAAYDKPVLKHHDLQEDPIGRITKSIWTPLKTGKALEQDFKTPDPTGSKGSGVVTVSALITDPDSIQKIIDGRYLSVSAGHSTNAMVCSVCDKSIMKCNHWPGKYYDDEGEECEPEEGFLCFYITGDMEYEELSFVNMPAQPPAKLVNFKWEDCSKEKFEKDNILIESMTRGKKSMVRDFTLVDDDGEFNLLKGLYSESNKKLIVAMTNQPTTCLKPEETTKVPQVPESKPKTASDTNIANSKTKGTNMDPNTEKNGLDVKTLETSLSAVSAEKDKLTTDLATANQKVATLESTITSKNSEIERLTKAQTDMQVELSKALATALASFRVKLGKPDAAGIDSNEKFGEYVTKLSKRTPDSLRDAIEDTVAELSQVKTPVTSNKSEDNVSANSAVSKDKLGNPAQIDTKNKTTQAGKETPSKTSEKKSALDSAFEE